MKTKDFTIVRGTEKLEYRRGVQINGKTSNLTVGLELNNKKGIFKIVMKMDNDQITGVKKDDEATMKALNGLSAQAIKRGKEWQKEWHDAQPKDDPKQSQIGDNLGD